MVLQPQVMSWQRVVCACSAAYAVLGARVDVAMPPEGEVDSQSSQSIAGQAFYDNTGQTDVDGLDSSNALARSLLSSETVSTKSSDGTDEHPAVSHAPKSSPAPTRLARPGVHRQRRPESLQERGVVPSTGDHAYHGLSARETDKMDRASGGTARFLPANEDPMDFHTTPTHIQGTHQEIVEHSWTRPHQTHEINVRVENGRSDWYNRAGHWQEPHVDERVVRSHPQHVQQLSTHGRSSFRAQDHAHRQGEYEYETVIREAVPHVEHRTVHEEVVPCRERKEIVRESVEPCRDDREFVHESVAPCPCHDQREVFTPRQEHHEVVRETVTPVIEHQEILQEHDAPFQEHQEILQETEPPCQNHREVVREAVRPCKDHREIVREVVRPCQERREIVREAVRPCQDHREIVREVVEPFQEHREILHQRVTPSHDRREVLWRNEVPRQEHQEILRDHITRFPGHHELQREGAGAYLGHREESHGYREFSQSDNDLLEPEVGTYQGLHESSHEAVGSYPVYEEIAHAEH
eukprot:TRINITY_DN1186_c0_g1_i1.p1 TRINITY_DN1186_c0_g1~~TRINITY_DN1186_c0_g1_i1.p1  ORF type:complete len:524 (+),score=40.95 TRINITY_DN1186_c0_g1_i1:67-1638(+)